MGSWAGRTFASLASRHFRTLWFGNLFSMVAFFMSTLVQAVVAYDLTGENSAVGFVVFGQGLAQLILGPIGGALADRVNKKVLIMGCQAAVTLSFAVLAGLVATDTISIAALVAGSFVNGVAFSFMGPARQAYVLDIVSENQRGNAVALNQVSLNASRVVGPGIASVMVAVSVIGPTGAYIAMTVLYSIAMFTTFLVPGSPPRAGAKAKSVAGDLLEGLGYVRDSKRLRTLMLLFVLVMMTGFPYVTLINGYVKNELGMGNATVGLLMTVTAVGALIAALMVASLADSPRALLIYSGSSVVFGLSLIMTAVSPNVAIAVVAMLLLGLGSGAFQTLNGAVIIRECDPRFFGRVMSLTFLAFAGFGLVGLPIGFIADAVGERSTLAGMGVIVMLITFALTSVLLRIPPEPVRGPVPQVGAEPSASPGGGAR
jgi:MFS family permease